MTRADRTHWEHYFKIKGTQKQRCKQYSKVLLKWIVHPPMTFLVWFEDFGMRWFFVCKSSFTDKSRIQKLSRNKMNGSDKSVEVTAVKTY